MGEGEGKNEFVAATGPKKKYPYLVQGCVERQWCQVPRTLENVLSVAELPVGDIGCLTGNETIGQMGCTGQCGPSSPFFHIL